MSSLERVLNIAREANASPAAYRSCSRERFWFPHSLLSHSGTFLFKCCARTAAQRSVRLHLALGTTCQSFADFARSSLPTKGIEDWQATSRYFRSALTRRPALIIRGWDKRTLSWWGSWFSASISATFEKGLSVLYSLYWITILTHLQNINAILISNLNNCSCTTTPNDSSISRHLNVPLRVKSNH